MQLSLTSDTTANVHSLAACSEWRPDIVESAPPDILAYKEDAYEIHPHQTCYLCLHPFRASASFYTSPAGFLILYNAPLLTPRRNPGADYNHPLRGHISALYLCSTTP
jgi:hypothetical protein